MYLIDEMKFYVNNGEQIDELYDYMETLYNSLICKSQIIDDDCNNCLNTEYLEILKEANMLLEFIFENNDEIFSDYYHYDSDGIENFIKMCYNIEKVYAEIENNNKE